MNSSKAATIPTVTTIAIPKLRTARDACCLAAIIPLSRFFFPQMAVQAELNSKAPSLSDRAFTCISEFNLRNLTIRFIHLEVGSLFEMEQAGDNIGRHNLGLGIVLLHDIVVELACVSDLLFQ